MGGKGRRRGRRGAVGIWLVATSLLGAAGLVFVLGTEAGAQGTPLSTPSTTTAKTASSASASLSFSSTGPVLVQSTPTSWGTHVVVTAG